MYCLYIPFEMNNKRYPILVACLGDNLFKDSRIQKSRNTGPADTKSFGSVIKPRERDCGFASSREDLSLSVCDCT